MDFKKIEKKWQKRWDVEKAFEVDEKSKKEKYYVLEQFPYPSGSGLHMGHAFIYSIGDIYARFKRMQGFNVLYPIGFDSFGLPAENAAIKAKSHPKKFTEDAIKNFTKHFKSFGNSYDYSRMIETHKPDFYKWDQWIFLKMLEKGLAYRKEAEVNWCPSCKTVLANEQAQTGECERCGTKVEMKTLEQWFLKITDYADQLYDNLDELGWPKVITSMQKNWIGKKEWIDIDYGIDVERKPISNCVIVHGSPSKDMTKEKGYLPENLKHWLPWMKEKLEKQGVKTEVPAMPTPWAPKYEEWKREFEKIPVDESSALIGHSAGGGFLVRWLGETGKKIGKLILVAPAITTRRKEVWELNEFYDFKINKNVKKNAREIVIIYSDDDREGILNSVDVFSKELKAKSTVLKNKGHLTEKSMGTREFPELLDEILSEEKVTVSTTRPDTNFGATFVVMAPEHELLSKEKGLVPEKFRKSVDDYISKAKKKTDEERIADGKKKTGEFTGLYCVNNLNGKKMPIWVTDFVLASVGTGAVVGVPGHDKRDFDFAKEFDIPIVRVVVGSDEDKGEITKKEQVQEEEGTMINSDFLDGMNIHDATKKVMDYLEEKGWGRRTFRYRLRDWLISRQRFWGTPIPIVYCDDCGAVPVPEKDLPVVLPENIKFDSEKNPLVGNEKFVNVKCPKCGGKGRRETDTMDTFVNSSWYYLRYCDSKNCKEIFDKKKANYWTPIDIYIGGKEHACMHDIYFRFYHKFLRDLGIVETDEPAKNLFNQGFVFGSDGRKMSKSLGNVVLPGEASDKYGVDSVRMTIVSSASPEKDSLWSDNGAESTKRFLERFADYVSRAKVGKSSEKQEHKINKTVRDVTLDIGDFKYNLAVIKIRELFDSLEEGISKKDLESCVGLVSPFCPHLAEELWDKIGGKGFVSLSDWPVADEKKINEKFDKAEQAVEKTISDVLNILKIVKEKQDKEAEKVFVYVLPMEKEFYSGEEISRRVGVKTEVFAVNDKNKYDPEEKSKKVKPGRPGIYVE